jgi:S-adenosylmethionine:tRNA ribosyltransferase-isomerase
MSTLTLSHFGYDLPSSHIATQPAKPRDAAKLLHVHGEALGDYKVSDLPGLLRPGDLLVVNDTRVIPAQLHGVKGAARIGITLDKPNADGSWRALIRNAKRLRPGDVVAIAEDFSAEVIAIHPDGSGDLRFNLEGDAFLDALQRSGALALPPYIARPEGVTAQDASDYQTMFAEHSGAVAAPTAGLHFTPALLQALQARGVGITKVTLHVGAGTFLPVRTERLSEHVMHAERGIVSKAAADAINAARAAGGRIVAVGTTALRLIESAADASGQVSPFSAETDIFILPGYRFRVTDLLFTNFHLPHSTLLMLVSAFAGMETIRRAYAHAIGSNYRFYSYGDACLLEPG